MKHGFLDCDNSIDSPAHRLDPRTKIILVTVFTVTVVSTPPPHFLAFVIYGGLVSWACALASLPILYVLSRAAGVLPFSILTAIWMPFLDKGQTLTLFAGRVHLSVVGLWILAGVVMKSFLGASASIWLISTTPFSSLLSGLRKLGVPVIIVDLLALIYRYLFVLIEEALRLRRAAAARGYRPRWIGQALLIGRLIGLLLVRSYERAERIYGSMVLRGFTGQMPASGLLRFRVLDAIVLFVLLPTLVVVRIYFK